VKNVIGSNWTIEGGFREEEHSDRPGKGYSKARRWLNYNGLDLLRADDSTLEKMHERSVKVAAYEAPEFEKINDRKLLSMDTSFLIH
jgi:hypothetical protein